jgi:VanZ family protein
MRWELILFLIGLVAIPFGCLAPQSWIPPLPHDKVLHFVAFGGMALLAGRLVPPGSVMLVLGAVFVAGVLIELLQKLIPGRNFCWRDLVANGAGIAAAGLCLTVLPA